MNWKRFKNTILETIRKITLFFWLIFIFFYFVCFIVDLLGDNTKIVLRLENTNSILKESIILLVLLDVVYWLVVLFWRFCSNYIIKSKYSEEKIKINEKGNKNFELNRRKQDIVKNTIYIINKTQKLYHPVSKYTFNVLGISTANVPAKDEKDESKFFSSEGYTRGKEIKIYNIINDIKEKIKLMKEIKD